MHTSFLYPVDHFIFRQPILLPAEYWNFRLEAVYTIDKLIKNTVIMVIAAIAVF